MTPGAKSGDEMTARRLLDEAETVLLDFDGPVCSVFAGLPASVVADQLRDILTEGGCDRIPVNVERSEDPFDVLKYAELLGDEEAKYVESALRAHEVEAVATALPTQGAHELIRQLRSEGKIVAIVSNNSTAAIGAYLEAQGLRSSVQYVSARDFSSSSLLKPNPHLLSAALTKLGGSPERTLFLGDSLADLEAAKLAGVPFVAYANKPGKLDSFTLAQADAIVVDIASLIGP